MSDPDEKPFTEFRLEFQGFIPVCCNDEGEAEYESIKLFLESISTEAKVDAQIVKFLEP